MGWAADTFARMTRHVRALAAACLAAGLLASLPIAPTASAAPVDEQPQDPLEVTIDRVGPSAIPASGRITITGTVTNVSDSDWSDLQVYPLSSFEPFTTGQELAEAAATDPATQYGTRRTSLLVDIPDLAPGESTRYRVRIPSKDLLISGKQGVYWLGVQVLGAEEGVREDGADGRARVFMPLMRKNNPPSTSLALMLQFRGRILRDQDGKVVTPGIWSKALSDQGRFGRLVEFSASAGSFPLTWVVDAALVDLARALAKDNPGFDITPAKDDGSTPTATPSDGTEEESEEPKLSDQALVVRDWLKAFSQEAAGRDVLALPYGDVDVAAAYRSSYGGLVERAGKLAEVTLNGIEVPSSPVVDPPDGALPWEAMNGLDARTPVVLREAAVAAQGPRVDVPNGPRLTLTDSSIDTRTGPLTLRQRILAEAAVHALSPDSDQPLVVQLPSRWDPGPGWRRARFFQGLDVPWLIGTSAAAIVRAAPTTQTIEPDSDALSYPASAPEIPSANFQAATNLVRAAHTLDVLLPRNNAIERELTSFAYLGTSGQLRTIAGRAAARTAGLIGSVRDRLDEVTVTGPSFVTMSSEDGPFQVTVTNGLDQPVTVGVRARAIGTRTISFPSPDPITIPGGQRRSVRMHANSSRIGVWPVVLEPVNVEGTALGESTELKIRSSHVGQFIWGVLGVGTAVLVVAIVIRVRRKVRTRRATPGPLLKRAET